MEKIVTFIIRYVISLSCTLYVHTIGVFFRHGRKKIRAITGAFGVTFLDQSEDPPNLVPEVPLAELCPTDRPIQCMIPEFESGGIFPYEMICMNLIVAYHAPGRVFEIGTFNGRTTLNIAANTPPGTMIFTLDLPFESNPAASLRQHPWDAKFIETRGNGRYFLESNFRARIQQVNGDSAVFDFSPYEGTIDLVFVDGSHSYEYVMSDSVKALKLLRNGAGVMLWHDYGTKWHDVTRALNDLYKSNPAFSSMKHIRGTSLVFQRFG